MKKLNWNDVIRVKLTDRGKDIYYHQYDWLTAHIVAPERNILKPSYPEVDENGYTEFQLWRFMELYGKYIGMCEPKVIEELFFYIDERDLIEVEER